MKYMVAFLLTKLIVSMLPSVQVRGMAGEPQWIIMGFTACQVSSVQICHSWYPDATAEHLVQGLCLLLLPYQHGCYPQTRLE